MNKKGQRRLVGVVLLFVAFGIIIGAFYVNKGRTTNEFPEEQDVSGPQAWELTNDAGQTAKVIVTPFTNSGTFSEADDSNGWFIEIPGAEPIRIPVSGNIYHTERGDRWEFSVSVMKGSVSMQANAEGYADGDFPAAAEVSGTLEGELSTPMGSQHVTGQWTGARI